MDPKITEQREGILTNKTGRRDFFANLAKLGLGAGLTLAIPAVNKIFEQNNSENEGPTLVSNKSLAEQIGCSIKPKTLFVNPADKSTQYEGAEVFGIDLERRAALALANVSMEAYSFEGKKLEFSRSHADYKVLVEAKDEATTNWMRENGLQYGFIPVPVVGNDTSAHKIFMYNPNEAILLEGLSEKMQMFGYCARKPAKNIEATIDQYYMDFTKADKAALKHLILQLNPTILNDGSLSNHSLIYLPNLSPKTELGKFRQEIAASVNSAVTTREYSHKVENGETLESLSLMYYGTNKHANLLQRCNSLVNFNIEAGTILSIPAKADMSPDTETKSQRLGNLTLWTLAEREYGDPELYKQLISFNKISDPKRLSPETVIQLPLKDVLLKMRRSEQLASRKKPGETLLREEQYIVKAGDTLSNIAKNNYGDSSLWKAIRDYNRLPDASLTIGQTLTIPNGLSASLVEVSSDKQASSRVRPGLLSGMRCSAQGIAVVKNFESLFLKAYKCPAGVWTIGYGHTEGVKAGQTLGSAKEAVKFLMGDLLKAEAEVKKHIHRPLTQGQFDALVSGEFNSGWIYLKNGPSDLTNEVNKGAAVDKIRDRMFKWVHHKKKLESGETKQIVSPGLARRRVSEALLFVGAKNPLLSFNEFKELVKESGGLNVHKIFNRAMAASSRTA